MTAGRGPLKKDLVAEIARLVGVPPPPMSTGSTEARDIFSLVNDRLALGLDPAATKPNLARGIVEASGQAWHPDCESRGSTVTARGLQAVLAAVQFFVG
jgi:hypothetical protein